MCFYTKYLQNLVTFLCDIYSNLLFFFDDACSFQVSKVVWKMLLKKHVELKSSKIFIYERTSFAKQDGKYMPYPKVDSFLKVHLMSADK